MKNEFEREELLNELVTDSSGSGPSMDTVLGLLRAEKRHRRQRKMAAGIAGTAILIAVMVALIPRAKTMQETAVVSKEKATVQPLPTVARAEEPFAIKRINDEELLEMLGDQPVALVTLANGEKRLLTVVHDEGQTGSSQ